MSTNKNHPIAVRKHKVARRNQRGMVTAEYAVGTVAAVGLGGILIKVLTDPQLQQLLWDLLQALLKQFFPQV